MHVRGFSAATIFVFATASPLHAQGIEVFAGYSANADYVQNRPAILIVDQKVSPFFSHGSGPAGFEASFKHEVRNGLGIKSMYPFIPIHSHWAPRRTANRPAPLPGLPAAPA